LLNDFWIFICHKPKNYQKNSDTDGLPLQGRLYQQGDVYYSTFSFSSGQYSVKKFKSSEPAYCGLIRVVDEADENALIVSCKGILLPLFIEHSF
jgi:hypothetical protein